MTKSLFFGNNPIKNHEKYLPIFEKESKKFIHYIVEKTFKFNKTLESTTILLLLIFNCFLPSWAPRDVNSGAIKVRYFKLVIRILWQKIKMHLLSEVLSLDWLVVWYTIGPNILIRGRSQTMFTNFANFWPPTYLASVYIG